jgi:ATP-dependent Clp protease ATP-binding subunit ClpA/ATP-dependent Clp protease ATP-binding subunit ClpC
LRRAADKSDLVADGDESTATSSRKSKRCFDVGPPAVVDLLSEVTGLPKELISPEVTIARADLERRLAEEVMGQPAAIAAAADTILRIKAHVGDPKRPAAVLLLTGPTGTGKTELAKVMASYLFGSRSRLVRFDMSELGGPDGVARLVGDALEPEGQLTRAIREPPLSVLLLDEIDKAHPAV